MKFKDLKFVKTKSPDGIQALMQFGLYELSVVQNDISYGGKAGLYEIGVFVNDLLVELPGITAKNDTVDGFLTEQDVEAIMHKLYLISARARGPIQRQVEKYATRISLEDIRY